MPTRASVYKWVRRHRNKHLCACGCGEYIEVLPAHHKRGIPLFLKGHNFSSDYNPRLDSPLSIDGRSELWEVLTDEEKQRRLSNLKKFGLRDEHPHWKGGRIYDESGYVKVRLPEHPFSNDGYIQEHRIVMERFLAEHYPNSPYLTLVSGTLYLKPEVVVHHIDEVKDNNAIENLFPFPDSAAHTFWHKSSLPDKDKVEMIKSGKYRNP